MELQPESSPPRHKTEQACLWETSKCPCISASPLHAAEIIQGKSNGADSVWLIALAVVSHFYNRVKWNTVKYSFFLKNKIHSLVCESD